MMIIWYVKPIVPEPNYNAWLGRLNTLIVFSVMIFIGFIMTELVEKPILRWRDKVFK